MKDKIWQGKMKYFIIAIVILVVTFVVGGIAITTLTHTFENNNVDYTNVLVTDKYADTNNSTHHFIIVSDNQQLFDIMDVPNGDRIYDNIEVGKTYHFVTEQDENNKLIHIVEVFNGTN